MKTQMFVFIYNLCKILYEFEFLAKMIAAKWQPLSKIASLVLIQITWNFPPPDSKSNPAGNCMFQFKQEHHNKVVLSP